MASLKKSGGITCLLIGKFKPMKDFKKSVWNITLLLSVLWLCGCSKGNSDTGSADDFKITGISANATSSKDGFVNANPRQLSITLTFSDAIDPKTVDGNIQLKDNSNTKLALNISYDTGAKTIHVSPADVLGSYTNYSFVIWPNIKSADGIPLFSGKTYSITTSVDSTDKFTRIPYDDLLTLVQRQTFNYFWDFGHPTSGMARERSSSGDVVTTGGTGFGIMAMIVAIERGFISRQEGLDRIQKIVNFLDNKCTKYHGAFSHWINGATGATVPFSQYDDGADLVETSYMFQALLTVQQYFSKPVDAESQLRSQIDRLWRAVEWTWFQKDGEKALYWHWSANYGWKMNMKITGWNEALIVYVLAASSPTYPISKDVYTEGWARYGSITNGRTFYQYLLPLGEDYGGPLFFSHYSFLGLNPKKLKDTYADYWMQNRNHSLINYKYCITNPKSYAGYSADCWGLTASDEKDGYAAHSPTNDNGTITPTAALSAMPYTPDESKKALEFFYYKLGDKIWKNYGFAEAFNLSQGWYSDQYLAIDEGPIILMIENYRSGLLWNTFMSSPYVVNGLGLLGFTTS